MTPPRAVEEWAKRHEKVEDVIFDGPVCRTCRHIDGSAVSYPCDAALILAYAAEQVAQARAEEREACAKVAEMGDMNLMHVAGRDGKNIAAAIRART